MRLSTIRMAGFKSFVDPTTFHAPTNMTGIVGPSGGGKSTLMRAIVGVQQRVSGIVEVLPGTFGPDLEGELRASGVSVGHFPQSFDLATVGGREREAQPAGVDTPGRIS